MQEQAEVQEAVMRTDKGYIETGVLDAEQVFNNRFKNGYTSGYQIDGDWVEPEEDDAEMLAELQKVQQKAAGKTAVDPKEAA